MSIGPGLRAAELANPSPATASPTSFEDEATIPLCLPVLPGTFWVLLTVKVDSFNRNRRLAPILDRKSYFFRQERWLVRGESGTDGAFRI
jgi:hypothetical protein